MKIEAGTRPAPAGVEAQLHPEPNHRWSPCPTGPTDGDASRRSRIIIMDKKPPKSPPVPSGRVGRQENGFHNPPAATTVKLATPPIPSDRVGSSQREFYEVPDEAKTPEPTYGPTEPWKPDFDGLIEALGRPYAPPPWVAPDRLSPRGQLDRVRIKAASLAQVGHIPPRPEVWPTAFPRLLGHAPGTVEPSQEEAQPQRHQDEHPVTPQPSAVEEKPECSTPDKQDQEGSCDTTPPPTDPRPRATPGAAPQPQQGPTNQDTALTEAPKPGATVPAPPAPAPASTPAAPDTNHATAAAPQLRLIKTPEHAERSGPRRLLGIAPLHARPPDNRRQRQRPQGTGASRRRRRHQQAGTAPLHARPPDSRRQRETAHSSSVAPQPQSH
ncbi:uncharacterized protein LOC134655959 [Cydia amplana]|uniref:uncharacterized protein LOC134655959 n=1 Tax=Cydia amplana TaxID=1869771 RepID=UPI002FE695BE